ncbi:AAA family ATPase [Halalkalibacter krulwichiae]|uniref:Rad50/SbcC-type AAA domain-containing protein n=1 Tax=Halalkalibacter krulwichiae TaxID=199441 RepID=A0A1X9MA58_9BACI|nr:AAA family ATPase [Halalkalibacter krulwichiae]ARK29053.1 hypothetical protein BkAM31D_03865 [Halalkalibacter krulwichiae]
MSRLILLNLIIQGNNYKRTIEFNKGLTIISGEKTSGKSLILSLIDYCLGKSSKIDLNVQRELDEKCDEVFLELKIGNEVLTLRRLLKQKQTKISIYFCNYNNLDEYTPKILDIKDAMKILMNKLNINEYKLIRHQKHSNQKEIDTVSFRDIFRFVYIHQHELGTGDFLEKKSTFKAVKNPHAFKMMFNLVDVDKETLNEQLVKVQNNIDKTKRELFGLNSYLEDLDALDRVELQLKVKKQLSDIEDKKKFKADVLNKSISKSNENNENKMYIKLKNDFKDISNKIYELQNKKRHLQISVQSKQILIKEYEDEYKEIEETLELNYKLIIPNQSIECPLCSSKVSGHVHNQNVAHNENAEKTLNKVKKQIVNKINLVEDLIEKELKQTEEINKEIVILTEKQSIFNNALKQYSKKTEVPYLSQIDSINSIITKLSKDLESLKEGLRIHNKVDEKEKLITDLELEETRLLKDIAALQVSNEKKDKVFKYLNKEYKAFMERLKYETKNETFIHQEQMIPYYNGASVYAHESGGLLECMQLSFIGAILKSKTEGYSPGHPGLLLLDSLSKYVGTLANNETKKEESVSNEKINDPEVYDEFFKILIELSSDHQIILVENTPPVKYGSSYTKYTFYSGKKGLIDEEKNEIKDIFSE